LSTLPPRRELARQ
jgi:hypothetical protein